jgi:YihY family inner membrane protein
VEKIKWPLKKIDKLQMRYRPLAFTAAVAKKYSDNDGGRLAALITYYSFLSLFPLLLAATTAARVFLIDSQFFQDSIAKTVDKYYPVLGDYLQNNVHGFTSTGLPLLIGVAVAIYGARGGASALRHALNEIWSVPKKDRLRFPASTANSLLIIFAGGGGILLATVISSYAAALTDTDIFILVPYATSFLILVCTFYLVFSLGVSSREPSRHDLVVSAVAAAVGAQLLQVIGGYLLVHELRNLSNLYGAFAVVLGLFFWIYLQVQVLLLAALSGVVHARKLWPRRLLSER